ncbi:MAG TPA: Na+/H+ antiporter subunit E [Gammaproteobacteria bacterium]
MADRWPVALTVSLVAMWLLLNQTLAPVHIVLGTLLAIALAWASRRLRPLQPRLARLGLVPVLLARVLQDIVRSNIAVARIVLGLVGDREIRSGFVDIPLEMRDPHALAVLAGIVTSTPGTVWVDLAADGSRVTLHVLDLRDEQDWIDWIKLRYERLLMGIFE